jgi:hypothetical protein
MKLGEWKTVVDISATVLGVVGLAIGGAFTVFQYLDKVDADRVKETLTFVERFQKPPINEKWERITSAWLKNEQQMYEILDNPNLTGDQWTDFVLNVVKRENIESDVVGGIDFFRSLQVCVHKKICDSETAKAFFGSEVRPFFRLHYPLIAAKRKARNDPSFAKELEDFIKPPS